MIDVFICVDASLAIGTGHLARCLILAEKLRERGAAVSFLLKQSAVYARERVAGQRFGIFLVEDNRFSDPDALSGVVAQEGRQERRWLLIDSDEPGFYTPDFQKSIRRKGIKLGMIVFITEGRFYVDLLHNQNPLALDADYQTLPATRQLLGLRYVILRDTFAGLQPKVDPRKGANIRSVLINFGGADINDKTGRITRLILTSFPAWKPIIVVGGMYGRVQELKAFLRQIPADRYRLYINTPEMPFLMAEAELAISGGGLTAWELGALYTPNVIIPSSWREVRTAEKLARLSLVYYFGPDDRLSDEALVEALRTVEAAPLDRVARAQRMAEAVNVHGAGEVAGIICEIE